MKTQKGKIIKSLNSALKQDLEKTILVSNSSKRTIIHGIPRLIITLKGKQTAQFYKDDELKSVDCHEKTWCYCSANGHLYHHSNGATEAISLSYYGDYIRAMHISYDGHTPPPTKNDIFYHADHAISRTGQQLLRTLDELAVSTEYSDIAPYLLKALLEISINDIKKSSNNAAKFNANNMWVAINAYIRAHQTECISRNSVAKHFMLSPGYISHLFQTFSHTNFSNTLLILRLAHAAELLKTSLFTVDEISLKSGFNYTSYFIRCFKKHYGFTPHAYRKIYHKKKL